MNRRVAVALGTGLLAVASLAGCSKPRPENVLLVTIDTLRADRLGVYGNPNGLTPHLDSIAEDGVLFEDVTAPVPITLPSHASILTGRYPTRTGVRNNGTFVLPQDETTLAEVLAKAGFRTAAVVAAHPLHRRYGLDQGFDLYDDSFPALEGFRGGGPQMFFPERNAKAVTDRALEVWNDLGEGPRFLWVHYFDPHAPYEPPSPFAERHDGRPYDGEVAFVDDQIGRLLDGLGDDLRRTLTIVTSDHGESLGEHGEQTHGIFVYQSTVHVPLLIAGPNGPPAGRKVASPVSLVDVMPTVLSRIGLPLPESIDGADLHPLIAGADDPSTDRPVYTESLLPRLAFRFSDLRALRSGSLKYVDAPEPEFYDLESDSSEQENLHGGDPRGAAVASRLAEYLATEDPDASRRAANLIDAESEAQLRSLGYVTGSTDLEVGSEDRGRDPKAMTDYFEQHDRALGLISKGRFRDGIEILQELLPMAPENYVIRFDLASGQLAAGRPAEAEALLLDVVNQAPRYLRALIMLAEVQGILGKIRESEDNYRKAIETAPWYAEPHYQLGLLQRKVGRFPEAASEFLQAVRLEPSSSEYTAALLDLRLSRGDLELAVNELEALSRDHPGSSNLLTARGRALSLAGRLGAAEEALRQAVDLAPGQPGPALLLGGTLLETGKLADAQEIFEDLVRSDPSSAEARFGLGRALALRGDPEGGDRQFSAVLKIEPRYSAVFTFKGRMMEAAGEPERAAAMYRRALSIRPDDREAWEALQRVRAQAGGRR
jgi:arylsulfatase A-like enzyme/predicted Zn-dependent protease